MSLTIICPKCGGREFYMPSSWDGGGGPWCLHSLCESCADKEAETVVIGVDHAKPGSDRTVEFAIDRTTGKLVDPSPPEVTPEMIEAGWNAADWVEGEYSDWKHDLPLIYSAMRKLEGK